MTIIRPCKPVDGLFSATKIFLKLRQEKLSAIDNLLKQKLKPRLNDVNFLIERLTPNLPEKIF